MGFVLRVSSSSWCLEQAMSFDFGTPFESYITLYMPAVKVVARSIFSSFHNNYKFTTTVLILHEF